MDISKVVGKNASRHIAALREAQIHSSWETMGADGTCLTGILQRGRWRDKRRSLLKSRLT